MADDFRDLFGEFKFNEDEPPRPDRSGSGENPYESTSEKENLHPRSLNEKEVKVMGIWGLKDAANPEGTPKQTFVLLRDNRGRRVPIFIGPFETYSISLALEGQTVDRPLTHDLLKNTIEKIGGTVERITIDDLWQQTFYARITIVLRGGETTDVDARPSDAIALALRTKSPIYMAESVIESVKDESDEDGE